MKKVNGWHPWSGWVPQTESAHRALAAALRGTPVRPDREQPSRLDLDQVRLLLVNAPVPPWTVESIPGGAQASSPPTSVIMWSGRGER